MEKHNPACFRQTSLSQASKQSFNLCSRLVYNTNSMDYTYNYEGFLPEENRAAGSVTMLLENGPDLVSYILDSAAVFYVKDFFFLPRLEEVTLFNIFCVCKIEI